jgi:hypothetical protein
VPPKLASLPDPVDDVVAPPIPDWDGASVSTSSTDGQWESPSKATRPSRPVRPVPEVHQGRNRRSRAFTTTVALASLFVVFIAVAVVLVLLHHSTTAKARTTSTAAVVSYNAAQLRTATQAIDSETTTARSTLHSLVGIPTLVEVTDLMTPYVSSLQHYQRVLSGAEVPAAARRAAANVHGLVSGDVKFLGGIDGLAPLSLGSYLEQFGTSSTQLQKDLGTLERTLRAPKS